MPLSNPTDTSRLETAVGTDWGGTDKTLDYVSDVSASKQEAAATVGTELLVFVSVRTDTNGRVLYGLTDDGRVFTDLGRLIEQNPLLAGVHDLAYAVLDANGRVLFGIRSNGSWVGAGRPDEYGADVLHILHAGQSLTTGSDSLTRLSTTQPDGNLTLDAARTHLIPLTEPMAGTEDDHAQASETPASGAANTLSALSLAATTRMDPIRTIHTTNGEGGAGIAAIKKGGSVYARGITQITQARNICNALGLSYEVGAVVVTHGEYDHNNLTDPQVYLEGLIQLWADYQRDITELTQQSRLIRMLVTQMSQWTWYGDATSEIPQAQLNAALARPNGIVLVGPKYMLDFQSSNPTNVGLHLSNVGSRHLGEYNGKVLAQLLIERKMWRPLMPVSAVRSGAVITLRMHVPKPPLVLDTVRVTDPGSFGFEFYDDSGSPPAISSVAVDGHIVTITLASVPTGGNKEIRYAYTGVPGAPAGPTTGARGNLRDSDDTPSLYDHDLFNWCVHFKRSIT